jgi:uncharacterized protein
MPAICPSCDTALSPWSKTLIRACLAVMTFPLFASFVALPAYAASFDCSKAATATERTICAGASLSELDDRLADLYKRASRNSAAPDSLRLEQREWLERRNSCKDAGCIKRSYEQRIAQLSSAHRTSASSTQAAAVCAALQNNKISGVPFPLSHALLSRPCWHPIPGLARIDLDNDGHAENLVRVGQCFRSCDTIGLVVADDTRTRAAENELNAALASIGGGGCGPNLDVFSYDGRTYVEAMEQNGQRTVFLMTRDKPPQRICVLRARR